MFDHVGHYQILVKSLVISGFLRTHAVLLEGDQIPRRTQHRPMDPGTNFLQVLGLCRLCLNEYSSACDDLSFTFLWAHGT